MSLTEITEGIDQFAHTLFSTSSQPPFSFHLDFSSVPEPNVVLGSMLITGAQIRYGKELGALTEREIGSLREYLQSIGWDADYHMASSFKEVVDYRLNGEPFIHNIKIKDWQITFKQADPSLRPGVGCGAGLT